MMASAEHQFILRLIVRRMQLYGARVFFVDGKKTAHYFDQVYTPPRILRHRPDVLGVTEDGRVCIGDAKTRSDITSKRTREQLLDFTRVELNGMPCEVFIGAPAAARPTLDNAILQLGLLDYPHLHTIYVPEAIVNRG